MINSLNSMTLNEGMVILDAEFSFAGPSGRRVLCEVSVIGDNGETILHDYCNPGFSLENSDDPRNKRLSEKGLTDDLLSAGSSEQQVIYKLQRCLAKRNVVVWNLTWETTLIPEAFITAHSLFCAMRAAAPFIGRFVPRFNNHRWIKLWDAIDYLEIKNIPGIRHRAATDTIATLYVWNWTKEQTGTLINDFKGYSPELLRIER